MPLPSQPTSAAPPGTLPPVRAFGGRLPLSRHLAIAAGLIFVAWVAASASLHAADLPFSDAFAGQGHITGEAGSGTGSNVGATVEPDEPRHGRRPGGRSVWLAWTAPADGIAEFSTDRSGFDTLLAVYAYDQELKQEGTGPSDPSRPFSGLREVAREDDAEINRQTSRVEFGVRGGVVYRIAIDGFAGAEGAISFSWDFRASKDIVPIVLISEPDRALREGDTLTLAVEVTSTEEVEFEWSRDDDDIPGATAATLVIPNFSPADVGTYRVRVKVGDVRFFTAPIEIQINSEGLTFSLARDKPEHAVESALIGANLAAVASPLAPGTDTRPRRALHRAVPQAFPIGVTRGFNGTQIFSTAYARRDPDEPLHCGVAGGASYWFAYQPPADGNLTFDTVGSTFDTVLAVYTFDPPLTGYADLVAVQCDNNSGPDGQSSRLEFPAQRDRTYLIAIDGVGGARGFVHLHYLLANAPPATVAPTLLTSLSDLTVGEGEAARFAITASGTEPLIFQWRRDGSPLAGATGSELVIAAVAPSHVGQYSVTVANEAGQLTTAPAWLRLTASPRLTLSLTGGQPVVQFLANRGWRYLLESRDRMTTDAWTPAVAFEGLGDVITTPLDRPGTGARFYRLRAE